MIGTLLFALVVLLLASPVLAVFFQVWRSERQEKKRIAKAYQDEAERYQLARRNPPQGGSGLSVSPARTPFALMTNEDLAILCNTIDNDDALALVLNLQAEHSPPAPEFVSLEELAGLAVAVANQLGRPNEHRCDGCDAGKPKGDDDHFNGMGYRWDRCRAGLDLPGWSESDKRALAQLGPICPELGDSYQDDLNHNATRFEPPKKLTR